MHDTNSGEPPIGVTAPFPRQGPLRFLIRSSPWLVHSAKAGLMDKAPIEAAAMTPRRSFDVFISDLAIGVAAVTRKECS